MEMLVRWKCSCIENEASACMECRGTGYIEYWVPLQILAGLTNKDGINSGLCGSEERHNHRLKWMEAFPS